MIVLCFPVKVIVPFLKLFKYTLTVILGITGYFISLYIFHNHSVANTFILIGIAVGCISLVSETISSLLHKNFALDYIAILAITVGLISGEYIVAAVIVLMLSGGETLEKYGLEKAKDTLSQLKNRIPDKVLLDDGSKEVRIGDVIAGQRIFVRKGEIIPLDGILQTSALVDQSSLTGEPYEMELQPGDLVRSGTVNTGGPVTVLVTSEDKDSTYRKIIQLVEQAQEDKSPFIRLADKYSTIFTIVTLIIAGVTYLSTFDPDRVLAVLVIATPCPLILATPIALMGGVSSAARKRIIVKKLSYLEVLAKINFLVFDKTGTLTLGRPEITEIKILDTTYLENEILQIADAIERSSLHPLAKAITNTANTKKLSALQATNIHETLGAGISGTVNGKEYSITKKIVDDGMSVAISQNGNEIAHFFFNDLAKGDAKQIFDELNQDAIKAQIFTGDKKAAVEKLLSSIGQNIEYKADCSPQDKLDGIQALQESGYKVGMVGDGLNDAAALAKSDVGLVFAHEDRTATTEAADIVLLGGDLRNVLDAIRISKSTFAIAMQSILVGIGLSSAGMLFAAFGFIPPIIGAFIQEAVDVSVIINALRTSRIK